MDAGAKHNDGRYKSRRSASRRTENWCHAKSLHIAMLLGAVFVCCTFRLVIGQPTAPHKLQRLAVPEDQSLRIKRSIDHVITDCMEVKSEEGEYYYKPGPDWTEGTTCGLYLFAEPDQRIELQFNHLDVPCEKGGLVAFVDGWELNGQLFPNELDHPRSLSDRFVEFCGQRKIKHIFETSQNAALIQYRTPRKGRGFSISVRFIKNLTPCNVLLQDTEGLHTIRNYGKRANCSLTALYPGVVHVIALNVAVSGDGRHMEVETGSIYKCNKRGIEDYVQIGGSDGLDTTNLQTADTVCGMNSSPAKYANTIFCGVTTLRMISSGDFDNSVTVSIRQATEDDISNASLVCGV